MIYEHSLREVSDFSLTQKPDIFYPDSWSLLKQKLRFQASNAEDTPVSPSWCYTSDMILHPESMKLPMHAQLVHLYLFVWVRAVIAEHQVGSPIVKQQVCGFEGETETLHALTEVKGVPQVVVGGVYKQVLEKKEKKKKAPTLAQIETCAWILEADLKLESYVSFELILEEVLQFSAPSTLCIPQPHYTVWLCNCTELIPLSSAGFDVLCHCFPNKHSA